MCFLEYTLSKLLPYCLWSLSTCIAYIKKTTKLLSVYKNLKSAPLPPPTHFPLSFEIARNPRGSSTILIFITQQEETNYAINAQQINTPHSPIINHPPQ